MVIYSDTFSSAVIEEDISIVENASVTLNGMCYGDITLSGSSKLYMHGVHSGSLRIEKSCECYIYGTNNGDITNYGTTDIYGVVDNCQFTGHNITLHKNSIVNKRTQSSDVTL